MGLATLCSTRRQRSGLRFGITDGNPSPKRQPRGRLDVVCIVELLTKCNTGLRSTIELCTHPHRSPLSAFLCDRLDDDPETEYKWGTLRSLRIMIQRDTSTRIASQHTLVCVRNSTETVEVCS